MSKNQAHRNLSNAMRSVAQGFVEEFRDKQFFDDAMTLDRPAWDAWHILLGADMAVSGLIETSEITRL
jgi:hypothetical protein